MFETTYWNIRITIDCKLCACQNSMFFLSWLAFTIHAVTRHRSGSRLSPLAQNCTRRPESGACTTFIDIYVHYLWQDLICPSLMYLSTMAERPCSVIFVSP